MKFACPKCKTRYSIADEKVPPAKTLRFPCKKCGNVMRLRRRGGGPAKKPVRQQAQSLNEVSTMVAPRDEIDRLRHAASDMGIGSDNDSDSDEFAASTRVASIGEIQKMASESAPPNEVPAGGTEWFVLIAGKQEGPLTARAVHGMLSRKQIDKRTYVWCEAMEDWKRLGTVPDFTEAAAGAGDAAWRVMAPVDEPGGGDLEDYGESTKAMDVGQLREALARTRDESPTQATGGIDEFDDEWAGNDSEDRPTMAQAPVPAAEMATVVAQDQDALVRDAFGDVDEPAPSARRDSFDIDEVDDNPFSDMPETREAQRPDLGALEDHTTETTGEIDDVDLISALAGEPTGDGMSRSETSEMDSDILDGPARFPDEPAPPPEFDSRSGEQMAARIAHEITGLDEVAEEPVSGIGFDGPSESDVFSDAGFDQEPQSEEYFQAPPGESTRVYMATAGLYKRRRTHRIAALVGVLFSIALVTVVSLDILGIVTLPLMGKFYDATGLADPNTERAVERVETNLQQGDLSPEERAKLEETRKKLMGNLGTGGKKGSGGKKAGGGKAGSVSTQGIKDEKTLDDAKRDMAKDIFGDDSKKESAIRLEDPKQIQAPNLPEGLTQKTIYKVIMENSRSMQLCLEESHRKGEKLGGKMEIELTINPNGTVPEVSIGTPKFRNTVMAGCTMKRVRNWKFPAFNGDPVTVSYPYVLEMSF